MKTLKPPIIFFILFSFLYPMQNKENKLPGFRNFNWGTPPEKIKKEETAKYLQTFSGFGNYALSFRGNFLDFDSRIDYSFKDSMLVEGSYKIRADISYKDTFRKVRDYFSKFYGAPKYWAITKFEPGQQWIKETDFGSFRGPELFWEFSDGFIAIQSSKFIEEITITVLYVHNMKINEYGNADVFTIQY